MNKLKKKILDLEKISGDLEISEPQRNEYLQQIRDYANKFVNNLEDTKAYSDANIQPNVLAVDGGKKPLDELIKLYKNEVAEKGINAASGKHFGYIPGGGLYASALADFLVDITNEYAGIYFSSPGAVTIENELLDWLKSIFNFPENAVGNLTSGGSIATLIAFTAARDKHQIKSDKISNSVVYLSEQVHHCVNKTLRIIGLEDVIIRYIELDDHSRIDAKSFELQIEQDKKAGLNPFLVVASTGTTDTGAVDPLRAIGKIAQANELWFHVDAAYGGFFILTEAKKALFDGVEMADSLIVDPHKGMFLPFGIGAVLVKDKEAVFHSNHYAANYMQDAMLEDIPTNPSDVSPELTKHFRGLRMWLPLRLHGIEPFIACLTEKLLLTEYFRKRLVEIGFEVGPEPDLSVSYFWFAAKDLDENAFNKRLMELIHEDGRAFLSSTVLKGRFVIRIAVLSFRTKLNEVDKAIEMIEEMKIKCLGEFNHAG
ncbi:MAG: pyridoxal phosphate-dependent decarboxylase family protein [Pyrinomonadaceae bacterium]